MNVKKTVVLVELMSGKCNVVLDSSHGRNDLSSWSEMGNVPQGLEVDVFTVEWVFIVIVFAVNVCFLELLSF